MRWSAGLTSSSPRSLTAARSATNWDDLVSPMRS
jgi:hypothetical protein